MKRIVLLTALATMMAAMALSGVAQANPITNTKADKECFLEAVRTLQPGFKPSDYTFHGGTEGNDDFTAVKTNGPDVFCGLGGDDEILDLDTGDIFLGGPGNEQVTNNIGTFYGEAGDDTVESNGPFGTFNGGEGNDSVTVNEGTISNVEQVG